MIVVKRTVLVVEDEFIVAYELKKTLEGIGCSVCATVSSGEEAVELAERFRPDAVLMDVGLKGRVDGIEAARRIHDRLGIRTAFLSGYPANEVMAKICDIEPIACFAKPLESAHLEAALFDFFLGSTEGVH